GRQSAFARVMKMDAYQIVPSVRKPNFPKRIPASSDQGLAHSRAETVQEIRQQKNNRAALNHMIQKGERSGDVRTAVLWLEEEHFADESQDVPAAFARGQK